MIINVLKECVFIYRFAIDKVLNNVRESFPVAEQLIAKVNEFQKRKTVDESQIAFATNNKIPQRSIMSMLC